MQEIETAAATSTSLAISNIAVLSAKALSS